MIPLTSKTPGEIENSGCKLVRPILKGCTASLAPGADAFTIASKDSCPAVIVVCIVPFEQERSPTVGWAGYGTLSTDPGDKCACVGAGMSAAANETVTFANWEQSVTGLLPWAAVTVALA